MKTPSARLMIVAIPLLLLAGVARADVVRDPIKLVITRYVPAPTADASARLEFELRAAGEAEFGEISLDGRSDPVTMEGGPARAGRLLKGGRASGAISLPPGATRATLRYRVGAEMRERELDLDRIAERWAHPVDATKPAPGRPAARLPEGTEMAPAPTDESHLADPSAALPPSVSTHLVRVHGDFGCMNPASGYIPADGIRVSVREISIIYGLGDFTLGTTYTDPGGHYDITIPVLEDRPDLYVHFETDPPQVEVQDSDLEFDYKFNTPVFHRFSGGDLDVGSLIPDRADRQGAVFIMGNIVRANRWLNSLGYPIPEVDVQWPISSNSFYNSFFEEIHLQDIRTWIEWVVFHEYGHHWMENFADYDDVDYCNGVCDSPDCGHCLFCEEEAANTWTEGVPDWIAGATLRALVPLYPGQLPQAFSFNSIEQTRSCAPGGPMGNPDLTEGLFAGALTDIDDANNEPDPNAPADGRDVLTLGSLTIFEVLQGMGPSTPEQFFVRMRDDFFGLPREIWQTARNNGFQLDSQPPGDVSSFTCTNHIIGVESPIADFRMTWSNSTDDWSGVAGYSIVVTPTSSLPPAVINAGTSGSWTSDPMTAGSYTVNIRPVDRAGNWSASWITSGPYIVAEPTSANIVKYLPSGWGSENLPRATNDATPTSAPAPTTLLPGNASGTWWVHAVQNIGGTSTLVSFSDSLDLDGVPFAGATGMGPLAAGAHQLQLGLGPFFVRGGLHTWRCRADAGGDVAEAGEMDNRFGAQWAWSPLALTAGVPVNRAAPPDAAATGGVSPPVYYNCDGLRFGPLTTGWGMVTVTANDPTENYDCRLHAASDDPTVAFRAHVGSSSRVAGDLDAVVVNAATAGAASWDVGVVNTASGTGDYQAAYLTSTSFPYDGVEDAAFADGEYAMIRHVSVPAPGPVTVTLHHAVADGPIHVAWFDKGFVQGALDDAGERADSNPLGDVVLDVSVPAAGTYAFVVWRDPAEIPGPAPAAPAAHPAAARAAAVTAARGRAPVVASAVSFTLRVGPTPPDVAPFTPPDWFSPIVPLPIASQGGPVPPPDTLRGDIAGTYFSIAAWNSGPVAISNVPAEIDLDGVPTWSFGFGAIGPGAGALFNWGVPWTIPGGRHTLSVVYDPANQIPEISDANNAWGYQFVWAPVMMQMNAPTSRSLPPDRTGGWTHIAIPPFADSSQGLPPPPGPTENPPAFNCDGMRSPVFAPGPNGGWGAVVTTPTGGADVDLRIHPPAMGAFSGFDSSLAASEAIGATPDFVLLDFHQLAGSFFDIGVQRMAAGVQGGYVAEAVQSEHESGGGNFGPFTLGSQHALRVHELDLPAGVSQLVLHPTSGQDRLGIALYGGGGAVAFGRDDVLLGATAVADQPGADATLLAHVQQNGSYAVAVWKEDAGSLAGSDDYVIIATQPTAVGAPAIPGTSALQGARPNPFEDRTALQLALATEGDASLEIFDVRGARVRTLLSGPHAPGTFTVVWDGRDDGGATLPRGLYFARLADPRGSSVLKIARVR